MCGGPNTEMYAGCPDCRAKSNNLVRKVIERNLAAGKCQCGKIRLPKKRVCKRCAEHSKSDLKRLKLEVIKGYGGKCACCGIDQWQFLSVDHVIESGADERL